MAEEEASARRRMPWYTKIIFASGHFLNALCWAVWFPYNVTFFTKVLELPSNIAGDIIITAQVFGAFSLPFIGAWSDQTQLKKFGRRKIFHLLGMVATAISFFFIWHECITCTNAPPAYQALYFASFAVVFVFGWCAIVVAQLSLIPELAPNKQTIVQLNALRNMFTYLGSIVVFICFLILLAKINKGSGNSLNPADKEIFWIMAIAVVVFGLLTVTPFQIVIRENPKIKLPTLRWFKWIQKPEFYLTALLYFSTRMVYLVPQTYMPFYFIDTLKMDRQSIAKGPLILLITSFLTTFSVKYINRVLQEKMTLFLGFVVVWGAVIWFWVQEPTNDQSSAFNLSRDSIYGAIILLGVGGAIVLAIAMAMFSYLVGDYIGSSAFVIGWMNFADLFFNGVAVKIIQALTPAQDKQPGFFRHVMVYAPFAATGCGLFAICGFLALEWFRKLKKKIRKARPSPVPPVVRPTGDSQESEVVMSETVEFPTVTKTASLNNQ